MSILHSEFLAIDGLVPSDRSTEVRATVFDGGSVHLNVSNGRCEFRMAMHADEWRAFAVAATRAADAAECAKLLPAFARTGFRVDDCELTEPGGERTRYASNAEAMRAGIASYAAWEASQQAAA